jgi:hypothetical protein
MAENANLPSLWHVARRPMGMVIVSCITLWCSSYGDRQFISVTQFCYCAVVVSARLDAAISSVFMSTSVIRYFNFVHHYWIPQTSTTFIIVVGFLLMF